MKQVNDYQQQLEQFINGNQRNTWIQFPLMKVYVRKALHVVNREIFKHTLDIATIEVDEGFQGEGVFTRFLKAAEQVAERTYLTIYIENILPDQFADFFRRRPGYEVITTDGGDRVAVKRLNKSNEQVD